MVSANTDYLNTYLSRQENGDAELAAAQEQVSNISDFFQDLFKAVNGVLAKYPHLAKYVDEKDLCDEMETIMLQGSLDDEIDRRLSSFALDYSKEAVGWTKPN